MHIPRSAFILLALSASLMHARSSSSSSCDSCSASTSSSSSSSSSASVRPSCQECGSSLFLPRPQGVNSAALFNAYYYSKDQPSMNATLLLGYRFEQTYKGDRIAHCLFGDTTLTFRGSKVHTNDEKELIADYFGLGTNFEGSVRFDPQIKNQIVDMMLTLELGNWVDVLYGMYIKLQGSLVHSSWNLRPYYPSAEQTIANLNSNVFPAGYFGVDAVSTTGSLEQALSGTFLFGDMTEQWQFGKFPFKPLSLTRLANFDFICGYDVIRCEDYHFGLFLKTVAPTGNRPNNEYVFAPVIGNGHHWELGGGLDAHYNLWHNDDQLFAFYVTGFVTHLFQDTQWRSFDFKDSSTGNSDCMSRYIALKELGTDVGADGLFYAGHVINAINFATRKIHTSFGVQGEATARFVYRNCGWAVAAGYNIYGRTAEHISNPCSIDQSPVQKRQFGIKGTTGVYMFDIFGESSSLRATENNARMYDTAAIDNPEAVAGYTAWDGEPAVTSNPPVTVSCDDLCFKGVPSQVIHKIFGSLDYQWSEVDYTPYFGIGGEIDIANNRKKNVCTPNQWGVWLHMGLIF